MVFTLRAIKSNLSETDIWCGPKTFKDLVGCGEVKNKSWLESCSKSQIVVMSLLPT